MSDFILVPDVGHGAWAWSAVWGLLSADDSGRVGRAVVVDLPGQGANAKDPPEQATLTGAAEAIVAEASRKHMSRIVVMAHGLGAIPAILALEGLRSLQVERVILVAGAVPRDGGTAGSLLSSPARRALWLSRILRRGDRMPYGPAHRLLAPEKPYSWAATHIIGRLGPFPRALLAEQFTAPDLSQAPPMTYVMLEEDRLVVPQIQAGTASRLGIVDVRPLPHSHAGPMLHPEPYSDAAVERASVGFRPQPHA